MTNKDLAYQENRKGRNSDVWYRKYMLMRKRGNVY